MVPEFQFVIDEAHQQWLSGGHDEAIAEAAVVREIARDFPLCGIDDGDALETYMTTRFTEEACSFIETQSASNKPFFVYLSYNAVHTPMDAPATPAGLSEGDPGWFPDAAYYNTNYPNMGQTRMALS